MHLDLIKAIYSKNMDEVKKYCDSSTINATHYDNVPLILAAEVGNLDIIDYLLQQGANPNLTNQTGTSALMITNANMKDNHLVILDRLLESGANINAYNRRGQNSLHYALEALTNPHEKSSTHEAKYFAKIEYLIHHNIDLQDFKIDSRKFEAKRQVDYYQKFKSLIQIAQEKQKLEHDLNHPHNHDNEPSEHKTKMKI